MGNNSSFEARPSRGHVRLPPRGRARLPPRGRARLPQRGRTRLLRVTDPPETSFVDLDPANNDYDEFDIDQLTTGIVINDVATGKWEEKLVLDWSFLLNSDPNPNADQLAKELGVNDDTNTLLNNMNLRGEFQGLVVIIPLISPEWVGNKNIKLSPQAAINLVATVLNLNMRMIDTGRAYHGNLGQSVFVGEDDSVFINLFSWVERDDGVGNDMDQLSAILERTGYEKASKVVTDEMTRFIENNDEDTFTQVLEGIVKAIVT